MALAGAVVTQVASAPGQTVGVSVFIDHIITDLDVSRSAVSGAYLVGTLCGALTMPAAGRLIDRRGLAWATSAFGAAFGAVLIGMAGVTGLATLTIGFAFTRILGQGALTLTATTTVAVWFDRTRGTAAGLLSAVGGGAMSLVPLASAAAIGLFGWRGAWIALGLSIWAVLIPLGRRVVRDPEGIGRLRRERSASPLLGPPAPQATDSPEAEPSTPGAPGTPGTPTRSGDDAHAARAAPDDWPIATIVRSRAFLVVTGAVALAALVTTGLVFHQVTLFAARGMSPVQAATNFVPQTIATAGAALAAGRLADRFPARWLIAATTALLGVAAVSVTHLTGPATAAVYGAVLGATGGAIRTTEAAVLPRWFGLSRIGELRGIVMAATVAGSAVGPAILAVCHDVTRSYAPALWALAGVAMVLAALAAATPAPKSSVT